MPAISRRFRTYTYLSFLRAATRTYIYTPSVFTVLTSTRPLFLFIYLSILSVRVAASNWAHLHRGKAGFLWERPLFAPAPIGQWRPTGMVSRLRKFCLGVWKIDLQTSKCGPGCVHSCVHRAIQGDRSGPSYFGHDGLVLTAILSSTSPTFLVPAPFAGQAVGLPGKAGCGFTINLEPPNVARRE
ncbi:hypothetical protein GGS23DRAFT_505705 [Durotheca rogersii]|uniref:uncharacterized protein n=1 Tax=Durotheca rogersii TaxID=419775 RepID=UPI00221EC7F8|nr:uncharacterized protein GGS23DRAFT_505705 [Durotheca rogersii]KAI5863587.1 hypothetical protein GGS23DRAFT_505705 [Durotheca rogersii]